MSRRRRERDPGEGGLYDPLALRARRLQGSEGAFAVSAPDTRPATNWLRPYKLALQHWLQALSASCSGRCSAEAVRLVRSTCHVLLTYAETSRA